MSFGHCEFSLPTPEDDVLAHVGPHADEYDLDALIEYLGPVYEDIYDRHWIRRFMDDGGVRLDTEAYFASETESERCARFEGALDEIESIDWDGLFDAYRLGGRRNADE